MLLTELGRLMEVRELQPRKALSPISVTDSEILMEVRELQEAKTW